MSITTKEEMIERLKHFASNNDALRNLIKTLQRAEKNLFTYDKED
jgi:hypothetical protein